VDEGSVDQQQGSDLADGDGFGRRPILLYIINVRLQELDWIGSCSGVEANTFGQFAGADWSLNGDRLGRIPLLAQQGHSGGAEEGPICDGKFGKYLKGRVVDLGCGEGALLLALWKAGNTMSWE
jgi:hypothetical protein